MNRKIVVAGAGIWGCTVARIFADAGWSVEIVEARDGIGGNCRCETDPITGIEIHVYGSHIFHTAIPEVWQFVNRFATFNGYQHKVLAKHHGKNYFLPLGLTLVNAFFGVELAPPELPAFMSEPRHQQAVFDAFFRNYTSKQWGRSPEDIDPSIIKRVPVRASYDVNYFNDYHQGIPEQGYNSLFERMLDHPRISVQCGQRFELSSADSEVPIFYSGPIDALFGYKFGPLPWRTLRFELERRPVADVQGTSVVNYVDADVPWTRQHEYKHFHPEQKDVMARQETIICREFPAAWQPGDEPYYPVNSAESEALLAKYRAEAARHPNLAIGGRLGQYKYFDMDKSVASALATARQWLAAHSA